MLEYLLMVYRPAEKVIPKEDPIIKEMTDVLRAWGDIWKKVYVVCVYTRIY